jgi:hypothetical protein
VILSGGNIDPDMLAWILQDEANRSSTPPLS